MCLELIGFLFKGNSSLILFIILYCVCFRNGTVCINILIILIYSVCLEIIGFDYLKVVFVFMYLYLVRISVEGVTQRVSPYTREYTDALMNIIRVVLSGTVLTVYF